MHVPTEYSQKGPPLQVVDLRVCKDSKASGIRASPRTGLMWGPHPPQAPPPTHQGAVASQTFVILCTMHATQK